MLLSGQFLQVTISLMARVTILSHLWSQIWRNQRPKNRRSCAMMMLSPFSMKWVMSSMGCLAELNLRDSTVLGMFGHVSF